MLIYNGLQKKIIVAHFIILKNKYYLENVFKLVNTMGYLQI
jgi:hypothetical protein